MCSQRFCQLTATGRSAVATIWITSKSLVSDLGKVFVRPNGKPVSLEMNKPRFGFWFDGVHVGEGIVVCQTGAREAEIHSHGGEMAPDLIKSRLIELGFQEVTQPTFISERMTRWKAEFYQATIESKTEHVAKALWQRMQTIDQQLDELTQLIKSDLSEAIEVLSEALSFSKYGCHLTKPWIVAILGKPNVGKSSLLNAVAGYSRAIVNATPGTTRDVVTLDAAIAGWIFQFRDTAGIRDTSEDIEKQGIERAKAVAKSSDVRIALFDLTEPFDERDQELVNEYLPEFVVYNKCDLGGNEGVSRPPGIKISALTGENVAKLLSELVELLVPELPSSSQLIPISPAQVKRLTECLMQCQQMEKGAAIDALKIDNLN